MVGERSSGELSAGAHQVVGRWFGGCSSGGWSVVGESSSDERREVSEWVVSYWRLVIRCLVGDWLASGRSLVDGLSDHPNPE